MDDVNRKELQERWRRFVADELMRRTRKSRSTIYNVLSGSWTPKYGAPAARYRDISVHEAAMRLERSRATLPRHPRGILFGSSRVVSLKAYAVADAQQKGAPG